MSDASSHQASQDFSETVSVGTICCTIHARGPGTGKTLTSFTCNFCARVVDMFVCMKVLAPMMKSVLQAKKLQAGTRTLRQDVPPPVPALFNHSVALLV
jgi:hypothetical protein